MKSKKMFSRLAAAVLSAALTVTLVPFPAPATADAASSSGKIKIKNKKQIKKLTVGQKVKIRTNLNWKSLKFTSSKKKIAKVTKKGVIKARKKGKTVIKISNSDHTVKVKVKVVKRGSSENLTDSMTVSSAAPVSGTSSPSGQNASTGPVSTNSASAGTGSSSPAAETPAAQSTATPGTSEDQSDTTVSPENTGGQESGNPADVNPGAETAVPASGAASEPPLPPDVPGSGTKPAPAAGSASPVTDHAVDGYKTPEDITVSDAERNTGSDGATEVKILSEAPENKITNDDYTISKKNKYTLTKPGTYIFENEDPETPVNALIEVSDKLATGSSVHLILNGVNIRSSSTGGDEGIITFKKQKNSNVSGIITAADGTVNTLSDSADNEVTEIKDDTTGEVISKKTEHPNGIAAKKNIPLTINGSGTLNISSKNGDGIHSKNILKIIDTVININGGDDDTPAGSNGISAKYTVYTENSDITVYSSSDALKTSLDEDDIKDDSSLTGLGNIVITGGKLVLRSDDGDGISSSYTLNEGTTSELSYGDVTIAPESLTITTYASSEEDGSYKGIKAGANLLISSGTVNIDTSATSSISSGTSESGISGNTTSQSSTADDAVHSNGYIVIDGGDLTLNAGDDAVHADAGLTINNGTVNVTGSIEGIEAADITVNGGDITVLSADDGFNAAGGSDSQSSENSGDNRGFFRPGQQSSETSDADYQIIINDGKIKINAEGDGIDSNGSIYINGGDIIVNGPSNGGNGALDIGDGGNSVLEINGGTLVAAAGTSDMLVTPTGGTQTYAVFSGNISSGSEVTISDTDGTSVGSFTLDKNAASVVYSSPSLTSGSSYTLKSGSTSLTAEAGSSQGRNSGGPGGGPGGNGGRGGNGGPGGR